MNGYAVLAIAGALAFLGVTRFLTKIKFGATEWMLMALVMVGIVFVWFF